MNIDSITNLIQNKVYVSVTDIINDIAELFKNSDYKTFMEVFIPELTVLCNYKLIDDTTVLIYKSYKIIDSTLIEINNDIKSTYNEVESLYVKIKRIQKKDKKTNRHRIKLLNKIDILNKREFLLDDIKNLYYEKNALLKDLINNVDKKLKYIDKLSVALNEDKERKIIINEWNCIQDDSNYEQNIIIIKEKLLQSSKNYDKKMNYIDNLELQTYHINNSINKLNNTIKELEDSINDNDKKILDWIINCS